MKNQIFQEQEYFFLLSGENPELAVFEFESIISVLEIPIESRVSPDNRVVWFQIELDLQKNLPSDILSFIMNRVTMVHFGCKQLFQIDFPNNPPDSFQTLISLFNKTSIQNLIPNKSFSVNTKRIGDPVGIYQRKDLTQKISSYFGAQILKENPTKSVDLENPEEIFIMVLSEHGFWFGQLISYSQRGNVRQRSANRRPFFHPSSMNPLLQRTMVNLAALKPNEWLLDPFCGTGGALFEAARMGIPSIGVEINRKIVWGAYQNLNADEIAINSANLIFGDATQLGFREKSISAVVTDPPYGIASSTRGFDIQDLLLNFFREVSPLLKPKARIVIAIPSKIKIEESLARILGASYKKFLQYVHRSLTRKILVFFIL